MCVAFAHLAGLVIRYRPGIGAGGAAGAPVPRLSGAAGAAGVLALAPVGRCPGGMMPVKVGGLTVTTSVVVTLPTVTVIVAVPGCAPAVSLPVASTFTTPGLSEEYVT